MAEKTKTKVSWKEWWEYEKLVLAGAWDNLGRASIIRSLFVGLLALFFQWEAQLRDKHATVLMVIIALCAAAIVGLIELLLHTVKTSAQLYKEQNEKIETHETAAEIKLSIEGVKCLWSVEKNCVCSVTIRNHSKGIAENVSVRVYGQLINGLYRPGFNPFHITDCAPVSGKRLINPGDVGEFQFPDLVNDLVHLLGFGSRRINQTQKLNLSVSSLTSPSIVEEYLLVENEHRQMSIIKNQTFQSMSTTTSSIVKM